MGSLNFKRNPLSSPAASWILGGFFLLLFIFPIARSLSSLVLEFSFDLLGSSFLLLVLKSLFLTGLQALISALLVLGLALPLGIILSHTRPPPILESFLNFVSKFGTFVFFLPSLSSALFIIWLSHKNSLLPSQGLWAVILAHFYINFFFVLGGFYKRSRAYLGAQGQVLFSAAYLLGAPRLQIYKIVWKKLLINEFTSWFAPIFWWSFSNFSTLLILGGFRNSSPEVLLFLSIQDGSSAERTLVLVFVQIFSGLALCQLFFRKQSQNLGDLFLATGNAFLPKLSYDLVWRGLSSLIVALLLLPQLWFFIDAILGPLKTAPPPSLLQAILPSYLFAGLSTLWVLIFTLLMSFCDLRLIVFLASFLGLSSVVLCYGFGSWPLFQRLVTNNLNGLFVASILNALMHLPIVAWWILPRLREIKKECFEAGWCLGLGKWGSFRYLFFSQTYDFWERIVLLCFISSLGEIVITSLVAPDISFLSTAARRLSAKYLFDEANWIVLIYSLTVALGLFLSSKIKKRGAL